MAVPAEHASPATHASPAVRRRRKDAADLDGSDVPLVDIRPGAQGEVLDWRSDLFAASVWPAFGALLKEHTFDNGDLDIPWIKVHWHKAECYFASHLISVHYSILLTIACCD